MELPDFSTEADTIWFTNVALRAVDQSFVMGIVDSEETYATKFFTLHKKPEKSYMSLTVYPSVPKRTESLDSLTLTYCLGNTQSCTRKKIHNRILNIFKTLAEEGIVREGK